MTVAPTGAGPSSAVLVGIGCALCVGAVLVVVFRRQVARFMAQELTGMLFWWPREGRYYARQVTPGFVVFFAAVVLVVGVGWIAIGVTHPS